MSMRHFVMAAAAASLLVWGIGCDKSDSGGKGGKKTPAAKAGAAKTVTPAPGTAKDPKTATGDAAKDPKTAAKPESPAPTSDPQPTSAGSTGEPAVGGPQLRMGGPMAGMNLASEAAGVLTSDMKLGGPGGDAAAKKANAKPDESLVPVNKDRHKTCQKLLDCTKAAHPLAPNSVTSYSVTRESVDSLEADEAAAECKSDLGDLLAVLQHEKVELPKACK